MFIERPKRTTGFEAQCRCAPDSFCGENCINRIMSYVCGKDCPTGDNCTNRSLTKKKVPVTKVHYAGARGFGLMAMEDIAQGAFVIDYRGEVISMDTFIDRIHNDYSGQRNFYALAYEGDEVIDAGMRGNEARFVNHSCDPNCEVRKLQLAGDGLEEYEVGMWAIKDIKKGEEVSVTIW
jgi:SET domain-containing protein